MLKIQPTTIRNVNCPLTRSRARKRQAESGPVPQGKSKKLKTSSTKEEKKMIKNIDQQGNTDSLAFDGTKKRLITQSCRQILMY